MDEAAFQSTCDLLSTNGFQVVEARYDGHSFGSWFVSVQTSPQCRIVWDGKDGWLYVDRVTEKTHGGSPVWESLWIASEPHDQTPMACVSKLSELGCM